MTKDFLKIFESNPQINKPAHREAPMPPFNEDMINESEFEDENRAKSARYNVLADNYISLIWESQEDNNGNYELFKAELERYFKHLAKKHKLDKQVFISVDLDDRDGIGHYHFNIYLNFDPIFTE